MIMSAPAEPIRSSYGGSTPQLNHIAKWMATMFARLDASLPAQLRIAIGFTSSGAEETSFELSTAE
jgi:hypothetical protein